MEGFQGVACGGGEGRRRATKRKGRKSSKLRRLRRQSHHLFPLALSALNHPSHPSSAALVTACLNEFLHLLFLKSKDSLSLLPHDPLLTSVIALLPLSLNPRCSEIVRTSLKILGAASLISYEVNEKIASEEGETLRAVLPKVLCREEEVAMAACNVVLDVSSTSLGSQRLLDLSALSYLMLGFLQVMKSAASLASICIIEKDGISCLGVQNMEDEHPLLLLVASVSLINFCNVEQLERVPRKLVKMIVVCLKNLWVRLHQQILRGNIKKPCHGKKHCTSNLTANSLAETTFRLSLMTSLFPSGIQSKAIFRQLFGADESSFENFILNFWESLPFLTSKGHVDLPGNHDVFNPFVASLNTEGTFPSFLSPMLQGMVSCFPPALDEMDIHQFLREVKTLACPILYQQDIRVVRTEPYLKSELHFSPVKSPNAFTMDDILRCEEAYKEGYTIALRGMEFRVKDIAVIADKLASLFGQPSVGANLYLTPPNSQGLACHYDDHCVFVCQLRGTKLWTVFPEPTVQLPRLYDCLEQPPGAVDGSKHILLREGDVLYIPRGFPHKACTYTESNGENAAADFSLHLTLAIEIEPPFEWEGFIHVSLLQWSQSTKFSLNPDAYLSENPDAFLISLLLHIAIRLISKSESAFRKACLVAATSLPSDTESWLDQNQRATFAQLIDKTNVSCSFQDALEYLRTSIQGNQDPFHFIRWIHVLDDDDEPVIRGLSLSQEDVEKAVISIDRERESAEAKFVDAKARFCREIVYDDVQEKYKMMHGKFKKVRTQYMNGMLSLHYWENSV